jgi:hypothetical protein
MKDYIRDNGGIRYCDSNIAKMNIFEFWWHFERRGFWKRFFAGIIDGVKYLGKGIILILFTVTIPVSYPALIWVSIYKKIKRAKEELTN